MPDKPQVEVSRRGFLKGPRGLTAASTVIDSATALAKDINQTVHPDPTVGPGAITAKLMVNDQEHAVTIEPRYNVGGNTAPTT